MCYRQLCLGVCATLVVAFWACPVAVRADLKTESYYFMWKNGEVQCGEREVIRSWTDPDPIPPLENGNRYWSYEEYRFKPTYNELWGSLDITYDPDYQSIVVNLIKYETSDVLWPHVFGQEHVATLASPEYGGGLYWGGGGDILLDPRPVHSWIATYWPEVVPLPPSVWLGLGMLVSLGAGAQGWQWFRRKVWLAGHVARH